MKKYAIETKWALFFFAAILLWTGLERAVGLHGTHIAHHPVYTNLFAIPAILIYVLALREKRDKYYGGSMSWKQGFMSGLIITMVVTILSPLAQWITHKLISPGYFSNAQAYAIETGKLSQDEAEVYFSLNNYLVQSMIGALILGVVTSAVVAIFVRKN